MSNLVIDIGNTQTKVALFNNKVCTSVDCYDCLELKHLAPYFTDQKITHSILCSVKLDIETKQIEKMLDESTAYTRFDIRSVNMISNEYKSPETLGLDRLAGVIGAKALYQQKNCLVIDVGTCITYDAIDNTGLYRGGSISLGMHTRLKAMHVWTDRLPLIDLDVTFTDVSGTDTRTSMLSGVIQGTLFEIQGFIAYYQACYSPLQVILCGGDAVFFDTRLRNTIFGDVLSVEPHLVLIGLNAICQ